MPPTTPPGDPPKEAHEFIVQDDPQMSEQGLLPPSRKSKVKATTSKAADQSRMETGAGTFTIPKATSQSKTQAVEGQSPLARTAQLTSRQSEGITVGPRSSKARRTDKAPYKQGGALREERSSQGSSRYGSTSTTDSVFVRGGGNRGGKFPQYRGGKAQYNPRSGGIVERGWGFPDPKSGEQPGPRGRGRGTQPRGDYRPRGGRGHFKHPECF